MKEILIDYGTGGPERPNYSPRNFGFYPPGMRICFLVHGFHSAPDEAKASFEGLLGILERVASVPPIRLSEMCLVTWPGYQRKGHYGKSAWSVTSYPDQVPEAVKAAPALAECIEEMRFSEVYFVAHSLGCRLVLETLQCLEAKKSSVRVPGILLMGAAVPEAMVRPYGALKQGVSRPPGRHVLYSRQDMVLGYAFVPGQILAKEIPTSPAIGYTGEPRGLWTHSVRTMNAHRKYYVDYAAARQLAIMLNCRVSREIFILRLRVQVLAQEHSAASARPLPENSLNARRTGA